MWASALTSTCTVSPTGSNGINRLRRPLKKLGEKEPATATYTLTGVRVRLNLQSWLPTDFHKEINHLLVGFGQVRHRRRRLIPRQQILTKNTFKVVCLPVGPKCDTCTLSTQNLCPSAVVSKSKVRKTTTVKPESAGPKIEIAIEETAVALAFQKEEPTSPCLSAVSSLTPEPVSE